MKLLRRLSAAFAAVCLLSSALFAGDPSGTWKWTEQRGNGSPREMSLTLELKDGKLMGKLTQPPRGGEGDPVVTEISSASIKENDIAFNVEREFNGNKMVSKYAGKLEGDAIKGKIERAGRDGQTRTTDWEAKRAAAK